MNQLHFFLFLVFMFVLDLYFQFSIFVFLIFVFSMSNICISNVRYLYVQVQHWPLDIRRSNHRLVFVISNICICIFHFQYLYLHFPFPIFVFAISKCSTHWLQWSGDLWISAAPTTSRARKVAIQGWALNCANTNTNTEATAETDANTSTVTRNAKESINFQLYSLLQELYFKNGK